MVSLAQGTAADGTGANRIVGSWSLVSHEIVAEADGAALETPFGSRAHGRLIFTPNGRMAALVMATGRRFGPSDAERAALHRAMVAYSGSYRVEGNRFITTVDVSGDVVWEGTEQVRNYRLEGDRLIVDQSGVQRADKRIVLAPQDQGEVGQRVVARLVWEREA